MTTDEPCRCGHLARDHFLEPVFDWWEMSCRICKLAKRARNDNRFEKFLDRDCLLRKEQGIPREIEPSFEEYPLPESER